MNTRERFHAVMNFQPFDRLPLFEWAVWWDKTIERWHGESLPADVTEPWDIAAHFGLDIYLQDWLVGNPKLPRPESHGAGIITSEADYEKIKPLLFTDDRVDLEKYKRWAEQQAAGDVVLWFTVDGFFWLARELMGIERHLYAFYDQPELMHQINADLANHICNMVDQITEICTPDFMTFAEDMSYNHGPMLSEDQFNEFMQPYYDRVIPKLKEKGIIPIIDSDGDIATAAHWFERAGLEGILPLERQAGVDIAQLRNDHPNMKFVGQFDKMTMPHGEEAMRAEFERLLPTAAKGGFLISCDHQTPPGVSYENYQIYIKLFREYAEKAGEMSRG